MNTDELKIMMDALSNMGESAKVAFIVYVVASYLKTLTVATTTFLCLLYAGPRIFGAITKALRADGSLVD